MRTPRRYPLSFLITLLTFLNVARADAPLVDFDRMGTVGLIGAFAGLDFFNSSSVDFSFDPSSSTLLSRSADGSLTPIASTNTGGIVSAGCAIGNTYYVAGSFSSIHNVTAPNVASYDPASGAFSALGAGGPNGRISALFCDSAHNKLWAGGQFSSPASALAVWDTKASSWSAPPFGGLQGASAEVLSITTNASQASLFFAGSFIANFGNASVLNTTNNPNVPFSRGATPFSSSLVPIPLEVAQIQGSPSSLDPSFNNIQNILCPVGNDGPGQTWFAADGNGAQITIRTFQSISASGVRLGNTFLNGRGTTAFTVTSLPDNAVQQLHYVDPATGQNQTCTISCPLSTDATVLYQDFTFNGAVSLTGVQVTLSQWLGPGPGLHLFQLLSSGAFASAANNKNDLSCFAPVPSNATFTGNWTELDANTNIPATTQVVLVSTVNVGTSPANGPSFTWMPYVSASGQYTINLLIPGCTDFQDCALRTSVQVSVFPGGGQAPTVTVVSQQNQNDVVQQIYNGPIVPSSPNFVMTVTMTLANSPAGSGQNGQYRLVADRIQLILTSANTTGTAFNGNGTAGNGKSSFGFLEWPLSLSSGAVTGLTNASETLLDVVGLSLFSALGGNAGIAAATGPAVAAVVHHPSGAIFIGGTFNLATLNASNIVVFNNSALTALSGGGLNGPVTSLALYGGTLFLGGSFTDTDANSTQGQLSGVASYDVTHGQWSPLLAGVNGPVNSLDIDNGQVSIAGNFTLIKSASSGSAGRESPGLALWNISNGEWVDEGGFLRGTLSFIGNGTAPGKGQQQSQILAGNIQSSLSFGASGFVLLKNGNDGQPEVTPLSMQLGDDVSAFTTTTNSRRSYHPRTTTTWLSRYVAIPQLFARQSTTTLAPLPPSPPAPAPAVLAGVFWTNTTNSEQVAIIGGNFTFTNGNTESAGVAIYNPSTSMLTPLQGQAINGTVRALVVQDTLLFVGGEFTIPGTGIANFAIYDLVHNAWESSGVPALQATSGASVVVRSLSVSSSKANTVIVAGSFAQAGSLPCRAICSWDAVGKQWNALGNGIQGDIASVAYAESNQNVLIAGGSVTLSGSSSDNVLQFTFNNATWSTVGDGLDLPGPVTAVTVNNGNWSSIFAAGRSVDGTSSFLAAWNGHVWISQGSAFGGTSNVSQLAMVPLQNQHSAQGIIEGDRMLMVSGSLVVPSSGQVSSMLFDGETSIPYIVSASTSGSPGSVAGIFNSLANFSFAQHNFLATGVVILISIAIAAGIVFLLVLLGILWTLFSRRDEVISKFDPAEVGDDDDSTQHRPSSLLAHINAATSATILGSKVHNVSGEKDVTAEADAGASSAGHDLLIGPDASNYLRAETPSDVFSGGIVGDETGRRAHARYSFDGAGEGELSLAVGQELEVLDDHDPSWWYARDVRSRKEGVIPASYVY